MKKVKTRSPFQKAERSIAEHGTFGLEPFRELFRENGGDLFGSRTSPGFDNRDNFLFLKNFVNKKLKNRKKSFKRKKELKIKKWLRWLLKKLKKVYMFKKSFKSFIKPKSKERRWGRRRFSARQMLRWSQRRRRREWTDGTRGRWSGRTGPLSNAESK